MRQLSLNLEPTVSRVERSQFNSFFRECGRIAFAASAIPLSVNIFAKDLFRLEPK